MRRPGDLDSSGSATAGCLTGATGHGSLHLTGLSEPPASVRCVTTSPVERKPEYSSDIVGDVDVLARGRAPFDPLPAPGGAGAVTGREAVAAGDEAAVEAAGSGGRLDVRVTVRVPEVEAARWREAAADAGVSVSDWLRARAAAGQDVGPVATGRPTPRKRALGRARVVRAHYPAALAVPQQAVVRAGEAASVWVIDEQQQAKRIAVELGELVDRRYRIAAGLGAGQRVVVEGIERLEEGAAVDPRPWQPSVAAGLAGFGVMSRSRNTVLPFCMKVGRDSSLSQPGWPSHGAHGLERSPAISSNR